jgi:hypothetical protein
MAVLSNNGVKSCSELLQGYYAANNQPYNAQKINFIQFLDKDIYNITAPFEDEGELVISGRVESRDSEQSEIYFFVQRDEQWVPREGMPVFGLQDPFYTRINGELIMGGVQTFPHPKIEHALSWRTVFYRGANIAQLEEFFQGPDQMKDLRLIEQQDGMIGVFTRPQGDKGGRGKIGYTQVRSLDDLTQAIVDNAPLLPNQFLDEEWGGCNEIHLLSNGLLGVLGHIACFDEQGDRHYYPMVFAYDPVSGAYSDIEIIAQRANFVDGPAKRPDLTDVVFSGGLVRHADGSADLYAGISDAEAHKITIADPFLKFER